MKFGILITGLICLNLGFSDLIATNTSDLKLKRKSEVFAGGVGLFPGFGLGHLYTGEWERSQPMLFTQGYGALLALTTQSPPGLSVAYGLILIGKVWESVDAFNATAENNKKVVVKQRVLKKNTAKRPFSKIALGYGLPYGFGSGRNFSFFLSNQLEVLLGFGDGSSLGLKYFLHKDFVNYNPDMGLYFGINYGSLYNSVTSNSGSSWQYYSSSQFWTRHIGIGLGIDYQIDSLFFNTAIMYQQQLKLDVCYAYPGQSYTYPSELNGFSFVFGMGIAL